MRDCSDPSPLSSLYTTFYIENYANIMALRKRDDGSYDYPLPLVTDAPFAVYSVGETGQLCEE